MNFAQKSNFSFLALGNFSGFQTNERNEGDFPVGETSKKDLGAAIQGGIRWKPQHDAK